MSDVTAASAPHPVRGPIRGAARGSNVGPRDAKPGTEQAAAREYAALRAQRAARISREKAAAQRRLVTAGVGTTVTVLFAVLALLSVMSWLWLLLPASFLVGTLAASIAAGKRTVTQSAAEESRLSELRGKLRDRGDAAYQDVVPVKSASAESTFNVEAKEEVPKSEQAAGLAAEPDDSAGSSSDAVAEVSTELSAEESAGAQEPRLSRASGGEWDYVPVPKSLHLRKPVVRNRKVHADTDIRGVAQVGRSHASVPGRPIRATKSTSSVETSTAAAAVISRVSLGVSSGYADEATAFVETGARPAFRFDLDAVLDQRRAQ